MIDTWTHIVKALSPEYDNLLKAMNDGPKVKCQVSHLDKVSLIQLTEYWDDGLEKYDIAEQSLRFDDYVDWAESQLSTWKGVRRMAWDQWVFKNKQEAEKFQTLFNLRWAR